MARVCSPTAPNIHFGISARSSAIFPSSRADSFAEPMVQLGETKVEIFASYNGLAECLGKRAGDFLRLPTGQPGSLEALSQFQSVEHDRSHEDDVRDQKT
jgi:hypothetical protein